MWKALLPLIRLLLKTPEQGAATSIYLASSPQAEGITGTYFADCKPKTSSRSSYDTATAARLWQISLDLVALTARRQRVPEPGQLAVDAPVPPARVVPGHLKSQRADGRSGARSSRSAARVRPPSPDQVSMPAQQGLR
jgi:hypothetical protein